MDVTFLSPLDKLVFHSLETMLSKIKIKPKSLTSNRRGFPERHRAITFGITTGRFDGITGLSHFSRKYPHIYEEILKIGKIICDGIGFEFKSIHLNNNVICPKHKDTKNVGKSVLVSFGDYSGANIVIEDDIYDAKYNPILFDGSKLEHWNTDDLIGNKYSLVFF